jgi:hypothetical protein
MARVAAAMTAAGMAIAVATAVLLDAALHRASGRVQALLSAQV